MHGHITGFCPHIKKSYNDGIYKDVHVTIIGPGLYSDYVLSLLNKIYNVGESSLIIMYADQE